MDKPTTKQMISAVESDITEYLPRGGFTCPGRRMKDAIISRLTEYDALKAEVGRLRETAPKAEPHSIYEDRPHWKARAEKAEAELALAKPLAEASSPGPNEDERALVMIPMMTDALSFQIIEDGLRQGRLWRKPSYVESGKETIEKYEASESREKAALAHLRSRLEKNEQEKAGATELCPVCSGTRVYGTVTGGTNPAPCYACAGRGYTTPDAPSPGPITSDGPRVSKAWADETATVIRECPRFMDERGWTRYLIERLRSAGIRVGGDCEHFRDYKDA